MATPATDAARQKADGKSPVIIDLGKHRRKRVKELRRGEGRLVDEVNGCIEELKAAGTLAGDAQTVVVVVREKRRRNGALRGLLPGV